MKTALLLLAAVLIGVVSFADDKARETRPPVEFRRHFVLRHPRDQVVHHEITKVTRLGEDFAESTLLVTDVDHGSFVLESRTSFADHIVSYTIYDRKREEFLRASFKTPLTAKTRRGALEEAARNPALRDAPVLIKLTTKGGEWNAAEDALKNWPQLRALRHAIRPTLSFHLLEGIERMRGTLFTTSDADIFYDLVARYAVYQAGEDANLGLEQVTVAPACDFDKSFGFPCSAAQLKRIQNATAGGKVLDRY